MKVTFWLSIIPGEHGLYGGGDLYTRTIQTGFLPEVESDGVYLWTDNSEDGDGDSSGPRLTARRRYMDAAGQWHVELQRIILDPPDSVQSAIRAAIASRRYDFVCWYSDSDGPISQAEGLLEQSGWVKR